MTALPSDPRIHVSLDQLRRLGMQGQAIRLLSRQPAGSVLNGRHASRLRGRGLNFEELRIYRPGDDTRSIDWKVTARTGEPHIRVYTEERDRPSLLLVDQRQSMFFGSRVYMKSVIAAEAAALAAHRVLGQGDRVGGLVFGDTRMAEHRPVRSRKALRALLSSVAAANAGLSATGNTGASLVQLNDILRSARRIARKNALVLIFSDFDGLDAGSESLLRDLALSNDLILFNVTDPVSDEMPEDLHLTVSDGILQAELNGRNGVIRQKVQEVMRNRLADLFAWSGKYGFSVLPLSTTEPALDQILRLLGHTERPR